MRKAFTMIELVFVIVILGALAAVAIPKLAATRDDAEAVKLCANIKTCTTDLLNMYTVSGQQLTLQAMNNFSACSFENPTIGVNFDTIDVYAFHTPDICQELVGSYKYRGTLVVLN